MKIQNKLIFNRCIENSFVLIIIETFISAAIYMALNNGSELVEGFTLIRSIYMTIFNYFGHIIVVFIFKIIFDLIPKTLIQYFLISIYKKNLKLVVLWLFLFLFGLTVSFFMWEDSNFTYRLNFNTTVAISYIPAVFLSTYILYLFKWNLITRALELPR